MNVTRSSIWFFFVSFFSCFTILFGMGLAVPDQSIPTHKINTIFRPDWLNTSKIKSQQSEILKINRAYGQIPLYFEPNEGQTDPQVRFLSRGKGYSLFITPAEAVFSLKRIEAKHLPQESGDAAKALSFKEFPNSKPAEVLRLRFEGGNRKAKLEGLDKVEGRSNYFTGNDYSKWRTNISNFGKVRMREVYPGIDLVYYGDQRKFEYDFACLSEQRLRSNGFCQSASG